MSIIQQHSVMTLIWVVLLWLPVIKADDAFIDLSGKPTALSSTFDPSYTAAENAIDGDTNGALFEDSCTHTVDSSQDPQWWYVDLLTTTCIDGVVLYNRVDCCKERLEGAIVRIGNDPNVTANPACPLAVSTEQIDADQRIEVACQLPGRYLSVNLPEKGVLSVCEVMAGVCSGAECMCEIPTTMEPTTMEPTTMTSTGDLAMEASTMTSACSPGNIPIAMQYGSLLSAAVVCYTYLNM